MTNIVYKNFPSSEDLFHIGPVHGLDEIGEWIAQHNMNVRDFKNWGTSNQPAYILRHDNRGVELSDPDWNFGGNRQRRTWFKWPVNREQLRIYDQFMRSATESNAENVDENVVKNSNNNSMIEWGKKFVKNMPTNEAGSLNNFKDGNKVIQYKVGKINKYISPYTFQKLTKMSPTRAYNKPKTQILFKNPFTRANVKRGEIKFMILKNAATKIQSVVRGKKARNVVQKPKVTTQRKKPVVREKMTRQDIERALRAKAQKARVSVVQERNAVARRKLLANAAARRK